MGGLCAACFGACQVHIAMHSLCCGFGEGKFREVSATTSPFDAEAEIAFDLKDASDLVMLDNKVLSLAEAIRAKKASTGAASVCYHTMQEKPGEDTFTLQQARPDESCLFPFFWASRCCTRPLQDHKVVFKPKAGQLGENTEGAVASATQVMGALTMPCHFWSTKTSAVVWMVSGP